MTAQTTTPAPGTPSSRTCPEFAWCDIEDHDQLDGSKGGHLSEGHIIELHKYPFVHPAADQPDFETVTVGLQTDADELQAYVSLADRYDREAFRMTIIEAEELGRALLSEAARWRKSLTQGDYAYRQES